MKISENLSSFIYDSAIYSIFNIINKSIPFLILPIIIRLLSTKEFGFYSLFINTESLLIPIISLNLHAGLSVHYFDDKIKVSSYLSTLFLSIGISVLFFFIMFFFIGDIIATFIGFQKNILIIAILTAGLFSIFTTISTLFRLMRKPVIYGLYNVIQSLGLFMVMILICYFNPLFSKLIEGRLAFFIFLIIVTILIFKKYDLIHFAFIKEYAVRMIKFSLPTVLYSISAYIFLSSDRFLIKYFLGVIDVAHYSAIYQLASIMSIVGVSINAAWMPWLFENLKKKDERINLFIVKISFGLIAFLILIGFIACFIFPIFATKILPNQYHSYINISYPIILGFVFEGIYLIVSPYVLFVEKTKYNALIGFLIAIINVSLNIFLIPKIGIIGASYAFLTSWMLLAVSFFIFSFKVYPMPWFSNKVFIKSNIH